MQFNLKSVLVYGLMIGSVVLLFKTVTTYGEKKLKAPPSIAGNYLLETEDLPQCLKTEKLTLNIQQSGIYLSAILYPHPQIELHISGDEKPSLDGRWKNQGLILTGSLPHFPLCPPGETVQIQATVEQQILQGNLTLNFSQQTLKFKATKEQPKSTSSPQNVH